MFFFIVLDPGLHNLFAEGFKLDADANPPPLSGLRAWDMQMKICKKKITKKFTKKSGRRIRKPSN